MLPPSEIGLPNNANGPAGAVKVMPVNVVPVGRLFVLTLRIVPGKKSESPGDIPPPPNQLALVSQKLSAPSPVQIWLAAPAESVAVTKKRKPAIKLAGWMTDLKETPGIVFICRGNACVSLATTVI